MRTELLDRARSVLVVVDVQERLMPAIHEAPRLLRRIELLAKAARALGVPAILTEQYPQGLGPTVAAVKAALPDGVEPVVKIDFSCAGVPAFAARLAAAGREQLVLAGVEAHVCVAQTALEFVATGKRVFLVADATGSRRPEDRAVALRRIERAGVTVTTAEAVVFEWLRRAGTAEFKALQPLLKAID